MYNSHKKILEDFLIHSLLVNFFAVKIADITFCKPYFDTNLL